MKSLLVLGHDARPGSVIEAAFDEFHRAGYQIHVATTAPVAQWEEVGADEVHSIATGIDGFEAAYHRRSNAESEGQRTWSLVRRDPWTLQRAAVADIVIATEPQLVYPVWRFERDRPGLPVRLGFVAALELLAEGPIASVPPATINDALPLVETAPRRRGPGNWIKSRRFADLLDPDLPDEARLSRALPVLRGMWSRGEAAELQDLAQQVLQRLRRPVSKADLGGHLVGWSFGAGERPANLDQAVRHELQYADALLAKADFGGAINAFLNATRMAFYRGIQLDATTSALAEQPDTYLAPFDESQTMERIRPRAGRREQAVEVPRDRPFRLLLVSDGNTNFLGDLIAYAEQEWRAEVRVLGPKDLSASGRWRGQQGIRRRLMSELRGDGKARAAAEEDLREHLDWADACYVEWCTPMTHYVQLADPGSTRIIVRLHSYEAWTMWPQLLDFTRLDSLVFDSDHIRELVERSVPGLKEMGLSTVTPNAMDLARFDLPKTAAAEARFNLVVVGRSVVAKDIAWAVEVVEAVRRHDPRYRLKIIGSDFHDTGSPAFMRYRDYANSALDRLDAAGGLIRFGRTEDVPAALRDCGVIISSSVREGSPLSVLEGAASGAVPVVRDWPYFKRLDHGPRMLYPADWVVDSVEEAATAILEATADEGTWREKSAAAREFALAEYDLTQVQAQYGALFWGPRENTTVNGG